MTNHPRRISVTGLCATLLFALPLAAMADSTLVSYTHFGGILGMGESDLNSTTYIQGVHKRDESNLKFTGAVLGTVQNMFGGSKGSNSVTIERVDDNLRLNLKPADKTYTEGPLYTPPQPGESSRGGQASKHDEDTKITKNDLEVKATGQSKTINGFDCREYLITWDLETENTKTGEKGKSLMTADTWYSEDSRLKTVHDDRLNYSRAYLKLMHVDLSEDQLQQFGFGKITVSGSPDSRQLFTKLRTLKGSPISTDVKWEASSTGQQNQQGGSQSQQSPAAGLAALGSLLGGGNKSQDQQGSGSGLTTIFTSHTEIKSVDTAALSGSLFEAPADYKKD